MECIKDVRAQEQRGNHVVSKPSRSIAPGALYSLRQPPESLVTHSDCNSIVLLILTVVMILPIPLYVLLIMYSIEQVGTAHGRRNNAELSISCKEGTIINMG